MSKTKVAVVGGRAKHAVDCGISADKAAEMQSVLNKLINEVEELVDHDKQFEKMFREERSKFFKGNPSVPKRR